MNFYQSISQYYDYVFPLNEKQVSFIKQSLNNETEGKVLLDIGCSTGSLCVALSELRLKTLGIDLDPEMIRLSKLKDNNRSTDFRVMDMIMIDEEFKGRSFDIISCFGNTLVHLTDIELISKFLIKCKSLLKPGGKLLIQILNYNYILDNQIFELPLIDNNTIRFKRSYFWNDTYNLLNFKTILTVKENSYNIENTIPLMPLRKEEIDTILKEAGFEKLSYFSSFERMSYNSASLPLVLEAI